VSTSTDLTQEARRDLAAVGFGSEFLVVEGPQELDGSRGQARAEAAAKAQNGAVLFVTYTTLAGPARGRKPSRLDQALAWATRGNGGGDATAWDGCIVFDECHKSKGLKPGDAAASGAGAGAGGAGGGRGVADDDSGRDVRGRGGRDGRGGGAGASSKVSLAVVELQARLPSARVLYTSATGVSSLEDCGYLVG